MAILRRRSFLRAADKGGASSGRKSTKKAEPLHEIAQVRMYCPRFFYDRATIKKALGSVVERLFRGRKLNLESVPLRFGRGAEAWQKECERIVRSRDVPRNLTTVLKMQGGIRAVEEAMEDLLLHYARFVPAKFLREIGGSGPHGRFPFLEKSE